MLNKGKRAEVLLEVLHDCFAAEADGWLTISEFNRADLIDFNTVKRLDEFKWKIQCTFGRAVCPQLKKGISRTTDAVLLLRQMSKAVPGCTFESSRVGSQYVYIDTDGKPCASRQIYRIVVDAKQCVEDENNDEINNP